MLARGFRIDIGNQYECEIDFVAVKESAKTYIQVAYILTDEKVVKREFGALESVRDSYPKLVLSIDSHYGNVRNGIKWQNRVNFLLTPYGPGS